MAYQVNMGIGPVASIKTFILDGLDVSAVGAGGGAHELRDEYVIDHWHRRSRFRPFARPTIISLVLLLLA